MTIKIKILCITIIAMIGLFANLSILSLLANNNDKQISKIIDNLLPQSSALDENINNITKIKEVFNSAISIGEFSIANEAEIFASNTLKNLDTLSTLEGIKPSSISQLKESFERYYDTNLDVVEAMINGDGFTEDVRSGLKTVNASLLEYQTRLDTLKADANQSFFTQLNGVHEKTSDAFKTSLVVFSISLLLLLIISYIISKSISENVKRVSNSLEVYATGNGDLTKRLPASQNDEVGQLVVNFNLFLDKLQIIIAEVKGSTTELDRETHKVIDAVDSQNNLREAQQVQITQIALSIREMTEAVDSIAKNAELASDNVYQTEIEVKHGNDMVGNAMGTIESLSKDVSSAADAVGAVKESVSQIGTILDAISGISEQTNLLALNAAIEAARAGEQGRGFAVVADEVRSLAGSTQQATLQIRTMIETLKASTEQAFSTMSSGRERASGAVDVARQAGCALDKINEAIMAISEVNLLVASASTQQAATTQSINENIQRIEEHGRGLAAQSEETQQMGGRLSELSATLSRLVGKFNT